MGEAEAGTARSAPEGLFELDSTLDAERLASAFYRNGRLQIPRILRVADSLGLYEYLSKAVDWGVLVASSAAERMNSPPEQYGRMGGLRDRELMDLAYSRGGLNGAHLFLNLQPSAWETSDGPILYSRFERFLNSGAFIDFVTEVSGCKQIRRITISASCYRPGHFYGFHRDVPHDGNQVGAIVFYLTPRWMPQWGGLLQFRNRSGRIEEAYLPNFNSMSIFLADQEHAVSCVASFADGARYSINGKLLT